MLNLVPYPRKIDSNYADFFDVTGLCNCTINIRRNSVEKLFAIESRLKDIEELCGLVIEMKINQVENADSIVFFGATDGMEIANIEKHSQGYLMNIQKESITIIGSDGDGLFYGLTTLWQMLKSEGTDKLPLCKIEDYPTIEIRGHFDDISRKRISTVNDFKRIVRELGEYKINYYAMYLEDVLHLKAFPDIGRKRGKLMSWEVDEIVEEARMNNVEIIPFFQVLGHCENLLSSTNYEQLGRSVVQQLSTLDPDKEEVRRFLSLCIKEVCEMFPCEYFGMGCDETQGVDADTYIKHLNWCAEELSKYGKKPLFWADMFYNHFGVEKMAELHPSIIPINWQYGTEENGGVAYQDYLEQSGKNIWGFGGYSSWCCYSPDFNAVKHHMDVWSNNMGARATKRNGEEETALLYSQWGDDGYENNRDLIWPLAVYAGETSWLGGYDESDENDVKRKESFDARFQTMFIGKSLTELTKYYNELASSSKLSSREYWRLHRKNATGVIRLTANAPDDKAVYEHDSQLFGDMLDNILCEYESVQDEISINGVMTYNHVLCCLEIAKLNADKMLLGYKINENLENGLVSSKLYREIYDFVERIRFARDNYINDWLINNRRECMCVSESVFDNVAASFEELICTNDYLPLNFAMVDLSPVMNTYFSDISGVPIGYSRVEGIPFTFANRNKTHVQMTKTGEKISAGLLENAQEGNLVDLHLVISSPMNKELNGKPVVRVTVKDVNGESRSEDLLLMDHLCDWWAPAGTHIWAGGGYKYADKSRVSLAMEPDQYFGLCTVKGFNSFVGMATPCSIEFEMLVEHELNLFAATFRVK